MTPGTFPDTPTPNPPLRSGYLLTIRSKHQQKNTKQRGGVFVFRFSRPTSVLRGIRRVLTLSTPATLVALLAVSALLASPVSAASAGATDPSSSAGAPRVLVIGMSGVQWSDVSSTTPGLMAAAEHGGIASNVVRSLRPAACPADGWLALSAGTRAADTLHPGCRVLTGPEPIGSGASAALTVPGWADYVAAAQGAGYNAVPGTLGALLADTGHRTHAFGPGAAIALADAGGQIGAYSPVPSPDRAAQPSVRDPLDDWVTDLTAALDTSDLVIIDAGSILDSGSVSRGEQVAAIDARIQAALAALASSEAGRPTTTLVLSLADSGPEPALGIGVAIESGPDQSPEPGADQGQSDGASDDRDDHHSAARVAFEDRLLTSSSTRQPGYVLTHDFVATLAARLGVADSTGAGPLSGTTLQPTGAAASTADRVATLRDDAHKSAVVRSLVVPFYVTLGLASLALFTLAGIGLARSRRARALGPRRALHLVRTAALAVAALPLASYLANLVPWWRTSLPGLTVAGVVLLLVGGITAVCLTRPWRDLPLGPVGVLTALTAALLAVDVASGARLQLTSLMGTQPLVAGRFYGFNNTAFTLFATATILLAAALADPFMRRGRRRSAVLIVAAVGLCAVLIDGLPSIGADFGGPPALVPGFAILALVAAGITITWRRLVVVGLSALAVVLAFSFLDWLRPVGSRTHLGTFLQTALDGGLWQVMGRKFEQNVANIGALVGGWAALLGVTALVVVLFWLARPIRRAVRAADGGDLGWLTQGRDLREALRDAPLLRPAVIAALVTHTIAFAINDSGITMSAIAVAFSVPLLIAAAATQLSQEPTPRPPREVKDGADVG